MTRCSIALALCVLFHSGSAAAQSRPVVLELGAGVAVPFAEELRDDYGAGMGSALTATSKLTDTGSWLLLDVGLVRYRGQELRPDPTFAVEDASLWLVPIRFGVRRDVVPPTHDGFPRVYLGAAFQTTFATASMPLVETRSSAAFGVSFELAADLLGNDRWRLWVRQLVGLSTSVEVSPALRRIDTSGAQLLAGLGYTLN